ncbi:MAG TPA: hypothetical protein ENN13_03170 [Candidatus Altiarchaeales archaeon]|nr:hypothetical protein [Candidatus Altiarchaeales archaeon]
MREKKSVLKDRERNPSGFHRCWASFNHKDDELWRVSKVLFESDAVVFFGSVHWGQMNAVYQRLLERLTWIENRHSTLGEDNVVGKIDAGVVVLGHNWRSAEVLELQKRVLGFFGFNVRDELCLSWQYTGDEDDESPESYAKAAGEFRKKFGLD